jgi:hypothetical protein
VAADLGLLADFLDTVSLVVSRRLLYGSAVLGC